MRKLIYVANVRLPTEKAHGIQIMEMCFAFAEQGIEVELWIPRRFNKIKDNPFIYYDIESNFHIRNLFCIDTVVFGRIGFWIESLSFAVVSAFLALFKKSIFYTRSELVALFLKILNKCVAWEGHTGSRNIIVKLLIVLKVPMVMITEALKDLYLSLGVFSENIFIAPDGSDISRFDIDISQEVAKKQLGLPLDKKIVLYKGHLYEHKGAHVLAESSQYLGKDFICVFIGGTEKDIKSFRSRFGSRENVLILGHKPRKETPVYQKASDILVIPNSAKSDVSKLYTSPMKLFGYMASGVPIVASNVPSLKEVLDKSTTFFFEPDNPKDLADTIMKVCKDYSEAQKRAEAALFLVQDYSWAKRAKRILDFISIKYK